MQQEYSQYEKTHKLPRHIRSAAMSLRDCRTERLGGHIQACPDGHHERHWYNSCKHRLCPQCAFIQIARWLMKKKAQILQCVHFHVIFTASDNLDCLWKTNMQLMSNILFACSRDTLIELLNDPKHLGALPGIIASFHSWSRTLAFHPHIHCLVTGGGLSGNGRWVSITGGYLLPFEVLRVLFRAKVLCKIRKAYDEGKLKLPEGMNEKQFNRVLIRSASTKWNVHPCKAYSHGNGVLIYLARYVRGGPIKNSRFISHNDGKVSFVYGRKNHEQMTLRVEQFLYRFLQHTPMPNSVLVRSYGLYHHSKKTELNICHAIHGIPSVDNIEFLDWQTFCSTQGDEHPERCPVCGKQLVCIQLKTAVKFIPEVITKMPVVYPHVLAA